MDREELFRQYEGQASEKDLVVIGEKLPTMKRGRIEEIWEKVETLWAMIRDPKAAWTSKAMAIGALLYLVSPFDAIPDPIPVLGLSDDATVIVAACTALASQLRIYMSEKDRLETERKREVEEAGKLDAERKTRARIRLIASALCLVSLCAIGAVLFFFR